MMSELTKVVTGRLCVTVMLVAAALAHAADLPKSASDAKFQLRTESARPREVEDSTELAIMRDYANAWKVMTLALAENRMDGIDSGFVGVAKDLLMARVSQQQKSGLRTRYLDRGHKLDAIFYSPEGSAMQLRDTAQVEVQTLDGDKIIDSRQLTQHYLVVMSVAEVGWKVRVLETVPTF
jgi:hypothetical protein